MFVYSDQYVIDAKCMYLVTMMHKKHDAFMKLFDDCQECYNYYEACTIQKTFETYPISRRPMPICFDAILVSRKQCQPTYSSL